MDNVDLQVLRQVAGWRARGERVILGTVTRTWGSAPRPVGSLMAINGDGHVAGSVSGGCIEEHLVERVRAGEFGNTPGQGAPRVVRYGVLGDEAARFGLPCGGTLELVIEPIGDDSTVCDPRAEYAAEFAVGATRLVRSMPDDAVIDFLPDAHTAVIALTHDPKLDDLALLEALRSNAFYVGAIGSRANQAKRRERLATHFDMTPEELDRLHGPVGLKNGARTPPEIAVAILAELTAARYGYRIPEPVRMQPGHATGGSLSRSLSSVIG
jgi:xanthine/CO dehydrogenase XdhC/CoxF family maturation factor